MSLTTNPPPTDADAPARLALRRYFLAKHHAAAPLDVLDCAHLPGDFWLRLRQDPAVAVATYWSLPQKPRKGQPRLDPQQVLCQSGWRFNVIDLHLRRSPWPAWLALLPRVTRPLTVFLTVGRYRDGDGLVLDVLGCGDMDIPLPLAKKLQPLAVSYFLDRARQHGLTVAEAAEVPGRGPARNLGLHLLPATPGNGA